MQKKLLAVALAGAFGAPAVAMAQSSTVQVFGTVYVEYSYADPGDTTAGAEREKADFIQTPGSAIGFKGEEKLGGGLSAWFQCASTADPRGITGAGFCRRNSALGLKGGFGNVFVGNWDTPFKRSISPGLVGSNQTGLYGSSFLLTGGSTTTSLPTSTSTTAGTGVAGPGRGIFLRRQNASINYDTPTFGGFKGLFAFSAAQTSTGSLDGASNSKPRVMSVGAQYSAGPIYVAAAYERHNEFNGAGPEGDDDGWHIATAYTFGTVRIGGAFTRQNFETGAAGGPETRLRYRGYHVGVDWKIVGPHGLRAAFTRAIDTKGDAGTAGVPGLGFTRPGVAAGGASNDNGAKLYQIRYVYSFSKRTEFTLGYARLDNDDAGTYSLGGLSAAGAGEEQDGVAVALRHTF